MNLSDKPEVDVPDVTSPLIILVVPIALLVLIYLAGVAATWIGYFIHWLING